MDARVGIDRTGLRTAFDACIRAAVIVYKTRRLRPDSVYAIGHTRLSEKGWKATNAKLDCSSQPAKSSKTNMTITENPIETISSSAVKTELSNKGENTGKNGKGKKACVNAKPLLAKVKEVWVTEYLKVHEMDHPPSLVGKDNNSLKEMIKYLGPETVPVIESVMKDWRTFQMLLKNRAGLFCGDYPDVTVAGWHPDIMLHTHRESDAAIKAEERFADFGVELDIDIS